jgi:polyhydroxyalkanoate synthase subunit PhaC
VAPCRSSAGALAGSWPLAAAARELPVSSLSLIASPFDFSKVRSMAPIRQLADLTGGRLVTGLYTALGGAPAPLVSLGFQLTALDKRITKPLTVLRNIGDRDLLGHMEAVDDYMANMLAYPGRTFAQLYHRFFRINDLADGRIELSAGEVVDVADIDVPVLIVAGEGDVLAPEKAVHHLAGLLTSAPEVCVHSAPGGHLGVLTGRSAVGTTWRYLDDFLRAHDERRGERSSAAAA